MRSHEAGGTCTSRSGIARSRAWLCSHGELRTGLSAGADALRAPFVGEPDTLRKTFASANGCTSRDVRVTARFQRSGRVHGRQGWTLAMIGENEYQTLLVEARKELPRPAPRRLGGVQLARTRRYRCWLAIPRPTDRDRGRRGVGRATGPRCARRSTERRTSREVSNRPGSGPVVGPSRTPVHHGRNASSLHAWEHAAWTGPRRLFQSFLPV
jgi:hypothetical protein